MKARCLWCGETLTFHAGKGWAHADGQLYAGTCHCDTLTAPHQFARDCRTWRDDHVATPDRTERLPI